MQTRRRASMPTGVEEDVDSCQRRSKPGDDLRRASRTGIRRVKLWRRSNRRDANCGRAVSFQAFAQRTIRRRQQGQEEPAGAADMFMTGPILAVFVCAGLAKVGQGSVGQGIKRPLGRRQGRCEDRAEMGKTKQEQGRGAQHAHGIVPSGLFATCHRPVYPCFDEPEIGERLDKAQCGKPRRGRMPQS